MNRDTGNIFSQEDHIYEGFGSLSAAETPAIGFDREPVFLRGEGEPPSDEDTSDEDRLVSVGDAKTPREMIDAAGVVLDWSRERVSRVFTAIQPILKYITGGGMELYDVFSTILRELPENYSTEDIENQLANLATELDKSADKPEYLGPVFAIPVFEASAEIELRDVERRRAGPNRVAGGKCRKCKSNNTILFQKQTRSADEGVSNITVCFECGYQGIEHN